jgi:hypothetical protein
MTSNVLPAAMNTSFCTRGSPGKGLPSSAMMEKPVGGTAGAVAVPICDPTIAGTCMREPALTKRTKRFFGAAIVEGSVMFGNVENNEAAAAVRLNATPLIK